MSFVETLTPTPPASASITAPTADAADTAAATTVPAVFTTEEISMIQEMFLSATAAGALEPLKIVVDDALISDKDFQISDISFADAGLSLKADELMLGADDATSVLLSPIGSDETFLNQFLFDEKDAMAAFYTEAIDPFECSSPIKVEASSAQDSESAAAAAASPLTRPNEQVLAKLRSKVDALSKMYYTRCHRLHGGAEDSAVDVEKVKRVHVLEKLQRIAAGLAKENAQLVKDTTSMAQQRTACMQAHREALCDPAVLEQIVASIDDQACVEAIARATEAATTFALAGDAVEVFEWQHKRSVSDDHVLAYWYEKTLESVSMPDVMRRTWECVSSSANFSAMLGRDARVQVLKKINENAAVLLHDIVNHDATGIDRVLSLQYRAELPNHRFVLGSCSVNPTSVPAAASSSVRWMESSMWQLHEKKSECEYVVQVGGTSAHATHAEASAILGESVPSLVRWENLVMGPVFRL